MPLCPARNAKPERKTPCWTSRELCPPDSVAAGQSIWISANSSRGSLPAEWWALRPPLCRQWIRLVFRRGGWHFPAEHPCRNIVTDPRAPPVIFTGFIKEPDWFFTVKYHQNPWTRRHRVNWKRGCFAVIAAALPQPTKSMGLQLIVFFYLRWSVF